MLRDKELRFILRMLVAAMRNSTDNLDEQRCIVWKIRFELKHRQAQRRIIRDRNRRGV